MATTSLKIFRETALPGSLQPNSIYLIAPAGKPDFVEMYVVGNTASTVKRIIDEQKVSELINSAVSQFASMEIVQTIAERDALLPSVNTQVLVLDASADPTVASGAATYIWKSSTSEWIKISEQESMDVVLQWANITGKPNSSPADIDNAVSLRHSHANKTQLDKISQDVNGNLTYNGELPKSGWDATGW